MSSFTSVGLKKGNFNMNLYFAPMEGITSYAFRDVHHRFFPGMDRYYTPFLMANQTKTFKRKELRDILPENNQGITVIPQILGNHAEDCLAGIRTLASYGYQEINFNLGCSMPQVANRGRGAGFLSRTAELDAFFEKLFDGLVHDDGLPEIRISVKTRIGDNAPEEAAGLLAIYNRYPICELIVHPRLRTDLYRNSPNLEVFSMFYEECTHPLCYNGDILSAEAYRDIVRRFPDLQAIMLGRGLIKDPSLATVVRGGREADGALLETYLLALREGYLSYMQSDNQVLPHMKEIWFYMSWHFEQRTSSEAAAQDPRIAQAMKALRKARRWEEFRSSQHILLQCW